MFVGRMQELKQLGDVYKSSGNSVVVVYGRVGIGKTELLKQFIEDKKSIYYLSKELSEKEQQYSMCGELGIEPGAEGCGSFAEMLDKAVRSKIRTGKKTVLVIEEFQLIVKNSSEFMEAVQKLISCPEFNGKLMVILSSSSVNWIENSMIEELSSYAKLLSFIIKVKEFSFVEIVKMFPKMSTEDCIFASAVLGGVPGYLQYWMEEKNAQANILSLILNKKSPLYAEAEHFLKSELRELSAYNAILATLASGRHKLNDVYARTGFSRAKISVYIKNLMELDVVEKIFSYDAAEQNNTVKGLYRIKDHYISFWYRYVFPHLSQIEMGNAGEIYLDHVVPTINSYMRECFGKVCTEFLKLMSQYNKLENVYTTWGMWYGKSGLIDIVAGNDDDKILVGFCKFEDEKMNIKDFEGYLSLIKLASLKPDEIFLFSKSGFADDVEINAQNYNAMLVRLEDL